MKPYPDPPPSREHPIVPMPPFLRGWRARRYRNDYRIYGGCRHVIANVYGPPEEDDKEFRGEIEQAVTAMCCAPELMSLLETMVEQIKEGTKPDIGYAMGLISAIKQSANGEHYVESGDSP
jgi:hypothetical protein